MHTIKVIRSFSVRLTNCVERKGLSSSGAGFKVYWLCCPMSLKVGYYIMSFSHLNT